MTTFKRCEAHGCDVMRSRLSRYCVVHTHQSQRYGHALAVRVTEEELAEHSNEVTDALARYWNRKPVQDALKLAELLLSYQVPYGHGYGRKTEAMLAMLRNSGVSPQRVLERVCMAFAFIRAHRDRFPNKRTEDTAVARALLHTVRPNHMKPTGKDYAFMGAMIRDNLGLFAQTLLARVERDLEEHRQTFGLAAFDVDAANV
jgi:hypothetical protein